MSQVITATYTDGVFKPDTQMPLEPGVRVRLIVDPLESHPEAAREAWEELEELCAELPVDSGGTRLSRDELHERR